MRPTTRFPLKATHKEKQMCNKKTTLFSMDQRERAKAVCLEAENTLTCLYIKRV